MTDLGDFVDNIATQILGSPPKYLDYSKVPEEELEAETEKVREQLKAALERASP